MIKYKMRYITIMGWCGEISFYYRICGLSQIGIPHKDITEKWSVKHHSESMQVLLSKQLIITSSTIFPLVMYSGENRMEGNFKTENSRTTTKTQTYWGEKIETQITEKPGRLEENEAVYCS